MLLGSKKKLTCLHKHAYVTNICECAHEYLYIYIYMYAQSVDNIANSSGSPFLVKVFVDENYCLTFLFIH